MFKPNYTWPLLDGTLDSRTSIGKGLPVRSQTQVHHMSNSICVWELILYINGLLIVDSACYTDIGAFKHWQCGIPLVFVAFVYVSCTVSGLFKLKLHSRQSGEATQRSSEQQVLKSPTQEWSVPRFSRCLLWADGLRYCHF